MPYNETLAIRIREQLKLFPEEFTEKPMFGGLSFLYKGKMTVGIVKDELAVRILASKNGSRIGKKRRKANGLYQTPHEGICLCIARGF